MNSLRISQYLDVAELTDARSGTISDLETILKEQREFQVITVSPLPMKNPGISNFHSSLTMNKGKLI